MESSRTTKGRREVGRKKRERQGKQCREPGLGLQQCTFRTSSAHAPDKALSLSTLPLIPYPFPYLTCNHFSFECVLKFWALLRPLTLGYVLCPCCSCPFVEVPPRKRASSEQCTCKTDCIHVCYKTQNPKPKWERNPKAHIYLCMQTPSPLLFLFVTVLSRFQTWHTCKSALTRYLTIIILIIFFFFFFLLDPPLHLYLCRDVGYFM